MPYVSQDTLFFFLPFLLSNWNVVCWGEFPGFSPGLEVDLKKKEQLICIHMYLSINKRTSNLKLAIQVRVDSLCVLCNIQLLHAANSQLFIGSLFGLWIN